ncbi:dio2 [Pungitius sinensis]
MGMASAGLLVTLQILLGFFSNCLFLALYDSVVLVKGVVSLLSCSRSADCGARRRMLTSEGVRSIWNSFLLDAYKQVKVGLEAPNSKVVKVPDSLQRSSNPSNMIHLPPGATIANEVECHLLDFESSDRPLVVNFGSAT